MLALTQIFYVNQVIKKVRTLLLQPTALSLPTRICTNTFWSSSPFDLQIFGLRHSTPSTIYLNPQRSNTLPEL